jgi:hypothetical protein
MISKAFRGFSRRAIRIFSRSVIGVPCAGIGDGTRCADRRQRVRSLDEVRSGSIATFRPSAGDLRFTPVNGHRETGPAGPVRATSGLMHRSKQHLYSMISSAMAISVDGTCTPRALAVLRFMTRSNLVDCTIGRSAGFSPLRMRPA